MKCNIIYLISKLRHIIFNDQATHPFSLKERNQKISIISDPEVLRKTDVVELINSYFDDMCMDHGLAWIIEDGLLTDNEAKILDPFHSTFEKLTSSLPADCNTIPIKKNLKDQFWLQTSTLAKAVLEELGPHLRP